jgi:hypothetical protein
MEFEALWNSPASELSVAAGWLSRSNRKPRISIKRMPLAPNHERLISRRSALHLAMAGLAAGLVRAEGLRTLPPPAPAHADAGLDELIARMLRMVKAKDARGLESLMLPTFRVEFDVGKGPAAFRRHWRSDRANSPLWEILGRVLRIQGKYYSPTLFAAPYVYTDFPVDLDPLAYVVALGGKVPLLEKPQPGSRQVATLDHSIISLARPQKPPVVIPAKQFVEVSHPQAGRCFVEGGNVYSPAAHRVFFEKRKGHWRWISLAAATLADPPDLKRAGGHQSS